MDKKSFPGGATGLAKYARISYPLNDRGEPMCFAYHLRGKCFEKCGRHPDHTGRLHSATERARALKFLREVAAASN